MIHDIDFETALNLDKIQFVDLRSPVEFCEASIPGAINLPLLDDDERVEVGTIYRHFGPVQARSKGLEFVGPRLAALIKEVQILACDYNVVLYCWRGGNRSQSLARVLDIMDINGYRLQGGFKAYRRYVVNKLESVPNGSVVVLHGLTGTGKTNILKELNRLGMPAIDLEGLANHRGSVFGGIGLSDQPRQKQFESILLDEILETHRHGYLIVESESRKIGRLFLPDRLYSMMQSGVHVLVYDSIENRVNRILSEYLGDSKISSQDLKEIMKTLVKFIGKKRLQEYFDMMDNENYQGLIRSLLLEYYDPLYGYASGPDSDFELSLNGSSTHEASKILANWLQNKMRGGSVA
ncbi:MAG: tRNA 2-selenouridine(34) synthase MnmH [Chitinophagales bacterium]